MDVLKKNAEVLGLLSELQINFDHLQAASVRIIELLKGFKRDQLDNLIVRIEHGDESELHQVSAAICPKPQNFS